MSVIWKQALAIVDAQEIDLPVDAEILCVKIQDDGLYLWYRTLPRSKKMLRTIVLCGTGHAAPTAERSVYLGTVLFYGGSLVLHAFEIKPEFVKKDNDNE